ncbi:hypothetical protein G3M65_00920 [Hydrogenobacter sp. T-8]|nr:hypothetical protein G3M65_00920 [Hydrogenobacter sp. T-8]
MNHKMVREGRIREIYNVALQVIKYFESGIRYSELKREISKRLPEANPKTIENALHRLRQGIQKGVEKRVSMPEKGLYVWNDKQTRSKQIVYKPKNREEDFYQPFANYLVEELSECTKAVPLGGNIFQDKWGTPDVIGVYRFSDIDPIKPPPELITAEIKIAIDTASLITAFGQACSYKLFSHKVYVAIPEQAGQEAISRLESLCILFGIGLILFNFEDPNDPQFQIRTRAQKSEPDYYYLNQYLRRLPEDKKRELFG